MPPFTPNDHMLDIHGDKGTSDSQIFSWCVRDAIAKTGNFKKIERCPPKRLKLYTDFMNMRKHEIIVDGWKYRGATHDVILSRKKSKS